MTYLLMLSLAPQKVCLFALAFVAFALNVGSRFGVAASPRNKIIMS